MELLERIKRRYSIRVVNAEGFSRKVPYSFMFKKKALKHVRNMNEVHPTYRYEVIDNLKGIKVYDSN